ncbi:MAG: hypothetical protein AAGC56_09410, partial [Pseudomonadota bacterium]
IRPTTGPTGGAALAVTAGPDRAAFDAAGFQDGDLVVEVDGASLASGPEMLQNLAGRLAGKQSVDVVVVRDGGYVPLTVTLPSRED